MTSTCFPPKRSASREFRANTESMVMFFSLYLDSEFAGFVAMFPVVKLDDVPVSPRRRYDTRTLRAGLCGNIPGFLDDGAI